MSILSYIYYHNAQIYNIGFVDRDVNEASDLHVKPEDIHWVEWGNYTEGWFADPFILDADDSVIRVLVEEFIFATGKGRISLLTINRHDYSLRDRKVVLDLDTHLSYPLLVKDGDSLYILPENEASGRLTLYRIDPAACDILDSHVLLEESLYDTQVLHLDDKWYLFATRHEPVGMYNSTNTLHVYRADRLYGPYTEIQTIDDGAPVRRGAGEILSLADGMVRPSQDCRTHYGAATIINRLDFDGEGFSETPLFQVKPRRLHRWGFGLHTVNTAPGLIVVDGIDYRWHYFSLWFLPLVRKFRRFYR